MLKLMRIILLTLFVASFGFAASAQDGGILIGTNFGGDPTNMNPLISNNTVELALNEFLFPSLYNIDPETRAPMRAGRNDQDNGLALDWAISDDGLVYTFTLRDDVTWNDGAPVTAFDYKFTFDALASGETSSPRTDVLQSVESVEAVDAATLVVTLKLASCRVIEELDDFGILPQHIIEPMLDGNYAEIDNLEYNKNPGVTAGVFNFGALVPDQQTSLIRNENHWMDVSPEGYIIRNVPDQIVGIEQFLAGEVNSVGTAGSASVPAVQMQDFRDRAEAGEFQIYEYVDDGLTFVGFNMADRGNPVNGQDDDGNPIDQGKHPLFGDARVRQAVAQAVNYTDIIEGAAEGEAVQVNSFGTPALWGYDSSIEPWQYNPEAALALLAEAGFVDDDDDPSTPLVATEDALYAEPGTPFAFELLTNSGNLVREAAGTVIQDQLGQIGIEVDFQTQEFGALVQFLLGQDFDAIMIGFTNLDQDTDARNVFTPVGDLVGGGFNFVSYRNDRVTELYDEALALPGCSFEGRQALYHEISRILHEDLPWWWLFAPFSMYAEANSVQNWMPYAETRYANMADIAISP
ncbi:MAG: ABC transporter substrate-binding protein [Chloroflexota bacterium]|nr:ABC transporter substrate-binding protein [Chloroflexota bacterium]MDE2949767.1 ABC transporter substrate-binding protein [Chloroflexota bacterium]